MMGPASSLIRSGNPQGAKPYERFLLSPTAWGQLPAALQQETELMLLGLWADATQVHACFLHEPSNEAVLASTPAAGWNYAALSPARPGAVRFERMILELWGHRAEGAVDLRPWLDHGRWPLRHPMAAKPIPFAGEAPQPEFLPTNGDGIHQIPVGPIHAGVIEPGHCRFFVQGEAIVRLEQRLGYKHKGT
ncbi:MAG: hydrogenase expression protein HypE, partial [Alphaproteobacteria bacterium]